MMQTTRKKFKYCLLIKTSLQNFFTLLQALNPANDSYKSFLLRITSSSTLGAQPMKKLHHSSCWSSCTKTTSQFTCRAEVGQNVKRVTNKFSFRMVTFTITLEGLWCWCKPEKNWLFTGHIYKASPDMPLLRNGTSSLFIITPAMSRCNQCLLVTNSCLTQQNPKHIQFTEKNKELIGTAFCRYKCLKKKK